MADNASQSLFVDFMYAVVVGAALPRINSDLLSLKNPEFWGVFFLLTVFIEDFYLYHRVVMQYLTGFPTARQLALTMLIIISWYVAQVSFPARPKWFLGGLLAFFSIKLLAGVLMGSVHYPTGKDLFLLIPICTCIVLLHCQVGSFKSLLALVPSWLLAVSLWWCRP